MPHVVAEHATSLRHAAVARCVGSVGLRSRTISGSGALGVIALAGITRGSGEVTAATREADEGEE